VKRQSGGFSILKIKNLKERYIIMLKTATEKIAEAQEKIAQYENQVKKIRHQQKEADRKARTKRLIERGAILESLIPGADALTNSQIKAFLEKTIANDFARRALANLTAQDGENAADTPEKTTTPSNPTPADKPAGTARSGGTDGGANAGNEARQGG
jgi:hypothetical protein